MQTSEESSFFITEAKVFDTRQRQVTDEIEDAKAQLQVLYSTPDAEGNKNQAAIRNKVF